MSLNEQRTEDWFAERCGHVTASKFGDVLAVGKTGKPLKARDDYLMRLVIERLTGQPSESIDSYSLQWGRDAEPFARTAYEAETGEVVIESGFLKHPTIPWIGCSPDGLIGADGGYESKCPKNSAVHLQTIRDGMPEEHMGQVQGCMFVTGRQWWDFVSFDPRMPKHLRLYRQTIGRDEAFIGNLEKQLVQFLAEVEVELQRYLKAA